MKHATAASLDRMDDLLRQIRTLGVLRERKRGVFYRGSRAALHFHEDSAGMFADLRLGGDWERLAVNTASERALLLRRISTSAGTT
jgi:hypothetical protein